MDEKRKLTYEEQVRHLEEKGVVFAENYTKETAMRYLAENNNLFKLSSYRKNYNKDITGQRYLHLDFAQLVDLAVIDMYLRQLILKMSLNIEHFAKVKLLRLITEDKEEDGYQIVQDYCASLPSSQLEHLHNELSRNSKSPYCAEVYQKYKQHLPVWVFMEIISFGRFISFYQFCAERFSGKSQYQTDSGYRKVIRALDNESYILSSIKKIRNAAAHNNCILNDLKEKSDKDKKHSNWIINQALARSGISNVIIKSKTSNERIAQIAACLYLHKVLIPSKGIHEHISNDLQQFKNRLFKRHSFSENRLIWSTFDFFIKVIDSWYPAQ